MKSKHFESLLSLRKQRIPVVRSALVAKFGNQRHTITTLIIGSSCGLLPGEVGHDFFGYFERLW